MRAFLTSIILLFSLFNSTDSLAQTVVRGKVIDGDTGEPMFSASVIDQNSGKGVNTDFDGMFRLEVAALPVQLKVSFIGYIPQTITVKDEKQKIEVVLSTDQILIEAAEVVGERISDKQKQAPLTVETMDLLAIKEAPT